MSTAGAPRIVVTMALPVGMTCADCRHLRRCVAFGFSWPTRTECDFYPVQFSTGQPAAGPSEKKVPNADE